MRNYKYYAIHIINRDLDVIVDNWKDAMAYTNGRLYMLKGFNILDDASLWLKEITKEDEQKVVKRYCGKDLTVRKTTKVYNDGRIEYEEKEFCK